MSESETPTTTDSTTKHDTHGRKRVRHRKKLLYDKILKQMEFYFSDANLTKDRFLGGLVKSDPYVPIEIFLKFNKIRAMTQDVIDIAKAMKFSTMLELSEDRQKIRRKNPVEPYDAESRTVYVESIPVAANREWLEKVFSDYGHVAYISLPKFKNSQKIKGYAFIEFDKAEDAHDCIMAFTKMGCRLPTSMQPEDLSSIKMFHEENDEGDSKVKIEKDEKAGIKKEEAYIKKEDSIKDKGDIKKEEDEPPRKKSRKNKDKRPKNLEFKLGQDSDSEKRDTPTDECKSITTPGDIVPKDELTSHDECKEEPDTQTKKKNRKKTAKTKSKTPNGLNAKEAPKGALWGLQVLPRAEWKALRNKYLTLQRNYMKQVKFHLYNKNTNYATIPEPATLPMEADTASNPGKTHASKHVAPLERIPGVFVKEVLPEPCCDVRLTKRTVRSNIHALHVDAKEGQSEIIIRFDSAKAADEYCANSCNGATILHGSEQEAQWARAEAGRAAPRPRGRERLRARLRPRLQAGGAGAPAPPEPAEPQPTHTHIRFNDE